MDDVIVPLDSLALTALVHRGTKWRRTFWEATCPERIITSATAATPPDENCNMGWCGVFYRTHRGLNQFEIVSE